MYSFLLIGILKNDNSKKEKKAEDIGYNEHGLVKGLKRGDRKLSALGIRII